MKRADYEKQSNKTVKEKIGPTNILTVFVPTFGLLDCTIDEINQVDIQTKESLTTEDSFHCNSDEII